VPLHGRVRGIDRDLIRGGHYGQRSYEPHTKAEHVAAPTKAAPLQKSPCQRGAVHTWHKRRFAATHKLRQLLVCFAAAACRGGVNLRNPLTCLSRACPAF
jgi:hypothetical protein